MVVVLFARLNSGFKKAFFSPDFSLSFPWFEDKILKQTDQRLFVVSFLNLHQKPSNIDFQV